MKTEAEWMQCSPLFALVNACAEFSNRRGWLNTNQREVEFYQALIVKAAHEAVRNGDNMDYDAACKIVERVRAEHKTKERT